MDVAYRVIGRPVPQGSMVASYNRRMGVAHVHHVQGSALALWRASVREGAIKAGASLTIAPVFVYVSFGMPRPKAHTTLRYGKRVVKTNFANKQPSVAPDLDKLVRAVLDALTGICYLDDAQVTNILASKVYADYTEIAVNDGLAWKKNAARLGSPTEGNISAGQLHLQDLWENGSE